MLHYLKKKKNVLNKNNVFMVLNDLWWFYGFNGFNLTQRIIYVEKCNCNIRNLSNEIYFDLAINTLLNSGFSIACLSTEIITRPGEWPRTHFFSVFAEKWTSISVNRTKKKNNWINSIRSKFGVASASPGGCRLCYGVRRKKPKCSKLRKR